MACCHRPVPFPYCTPRSFAPAALTPCLRCGVSGGSHRSGGGRDGIRTARRTSVVFSPIRGEGNGRHRGGGCGRRCGANSSRTTREPDLPPLSAARWRMCSRKEVINSAEVGAAPVGDGSVPTPSGTSPGGLTAPSTGEESMPTRGGACEVRRASIGGAVVCCACWRAVWRRGGRAQPPT